MKEIINGETVLKRIGDVAAMRGLTERNLSKKIGKNAAYIAILKYERRWPTVQALIKICDCVGITLSAFFAPLERESGEGALLLCRLQEKVPKEYRKKLYEAMAVLDSEFLQTQFKMLHAYAKCCQK